jgi:hypothetical protein
VQAHEILIARKGLAVWFLFQEVGLCDLCGGFSVVYYYQMYYFSFQ